MCYNRWLLLRVVCSIFVSLSLLVNYGVFIYLTVNCFFFQNRLLAFVSLSISRSAMHSSRIILSVCGIKNSVTNLTEFFLNTKFFYKIRIVMLRHLVVVWFFFVLFGILYFFFRCHWYHCFARYRPYHIIFINLVVN